MRRPRGLSSSLLPLLCCGCWAGHALAAYADSAPVAQIVRRSVAVNTTDWKAQPRYVHQEQYQKCKLSLSGKAQYDPTRTSDVMMIEGTPYYRLIALNREPLSREQEQQEQAKLKREMERRQHESAADRQARISKYQNERAEEHLLMEEMVRAFDFKLVGEEQINGVDCYVLDASPNPDYQPTVEKAKVLTGMHGRLWIEKHGYHWAKVQAEVTTPVDFGFFIAKVKPGTRFELQQAPVGDVWLPQCFIESVNASVLGMYGIRTREESHFSDYRRIDQPAANAAADGHLIMATAQTHTSER